MLITNLNIKTYTDERIKQCAKIKHLSTKTIKCTPVRDNKSNNKYSKNSKTKNKKK